MFMIDNRQAKTIKEIKGDWQKKEELSRKAAEHNLRMSRTYLLEIQNCARHSMVYGEENMKPAPIEFRGNPVQTILNTDAVSAVKTYAEKYQNVCLLNFASYKNPGGGFLMGSRAQEEAICHESILFEVLNSNELKKYYAWNNQHKNRGLYLNRAIYSPNITFERQGIVFRANVLTCAAPNIAAAERYNMATSEENREIIKERMKFIAEILEQNKVDCFIGGAWGCGVFGQRPEEIATLYKTTKFGESLKEIVHPIIGNNNNYDVFKEILK